MPERTCPPSLTRGITAEGKRKVEYAYHFAWQHLSPFKRRTGASYARHGTVVALVLREINADPSLVAVALVHDVFLLQDGATLLRKSGLTKDEQSLARSMHDLRRLHINKKTKDLDRVIGAFSSDERLLVLRMAHRLNDVRNLADFEHQGPERLRSGHGITVRDQGPA